MLDEKRVCTKCHFEKPIAEFLVTDKGTGRRRLHCRECEAAHVREYYATSEHYRSTVRARTAANAKLNPRTAEQSRRYNLKNKYGIEPEQYDQLLKDQDGKCALCQTTDIGRGGPENKWRAGHWNVDHCHTDGHVRGLLCHKCNVAIGQYELLMKNIGEALVTDYLTRPSPIVHAEPDPESVYRHVPDFMHPNPKPGPIAQIAAACSVDGCAGGSVARGLCQKHYARFQRRDGDIGSADHLPHTSAKGSAHPKSKLTEDMVREIRSSSETGVVLAAKFGITTALVSNVRLRKVWRHVE